MQFVTGSLKRHKGGEESLEEFYSGDIEEGGVNVMREAVEIYL